MATFYAMVRVEVEAETADEARDLYYEAMEMVSNANIGMAVNFAFEVDFEGEDE